MIAITTLILLSIGTGSSWYWKSDWSVHQAIDIQSVRHHPNITRRSVQVVTRSAPDCQTEVDTSITDNNNAEVKGLLLVPDLPDVCYLRDISQAELQSVSTCDPGPASPTIIFAVSGLLAPPINTNIYDGTTIEDVTSGNSYEPPEETIPHI